METCPYCNAETRPGDNFCLNCGHRLLPATPSPQGDATLPAQDDWMAAFQKPQASTPNWSDVNAQTVASTVMGDTELPTIGPNALGGASAAATVAAPPIDTVPNPARLILRADNGEVLNEYVLDKFETTIGRAPTSNILLSKDKLTSRRHATVRYENGNYVLYDERSANGTFVNGQQLEDGPRVLQDGDHVGIGEHELIFRSSASPNVDIEKVDTIAVSFDPSGGFVTGSTQVDSEMTRPASDEQDVLETRTMSNGTSGSLSSASPQPEISRAMAPKSEDVPPVPVPLAVPASPPAPVINEPAPPAKGWPVGSVTSEASTNTPTLGTDADVTFNRLTSLPQPTLPDIAPLMAALSALDGQVSALQKQLNTTQEVMRKHEADIAQAANQLRAGVRGVSERMDSTISDVARSREALAWADLKQLMEDVMNNPRDIEYVSKLGRKARELNKIFQLHQEVLNTLAECNSLLRSLIGEKK